jgi:transcriptional regulator with XRE-family HTH domain
MNMAKDTEDPTMPRIRDWLEKSGKTLHELGVAMGFPESQARKAVWQFLRSKDPRIGTLRKFAAAVNMPLSELIDEPKGKAKK